MIQIISSYLGAISRISDPSYHISVIKNDNKLDKQKWNEMCRRIANNGALGMREFPFWSEKIEDAGFLPWKLVEKNGKKSFDLDQFNDIYFDNLSDMVEIANKYKMEFFLSLYDNCGIKKLSDYNPWTNNIQGLKDFYVANTDKNIKYLKKWEDEVLNTLTDLNVSYEICNEPRIGGEQFVYDASCRLREKDVSSSNILTGINYDLFNQNKSYTIFKRILKEKEGEAAYDALKKEWSTCVHNLNDDIFEELKKQKGHTRRFWLSTDGVHPKPDKNWWKKNLKNILPKIGDHAHARWWAFETIHKNDDDDFDSALGIAEPLIDAGYISDIIGDYPINDPIDINPLNPAAKEIMLDLIYSIKCFGDKPDSWKNGHLNAWENIKRILDRYIDRYL
jgi:hypothetical protein